MIPQRYLMRIRKERYIHQYNPCYVTKNGAFTEYLSTGEVIASNNYYCYYFHPSCPREAVH